MIHLIGLIVNRPDIAVHLLRCICHTIHDSFYISLHRCDRSLEVMGNVADQFFIFLIHGDFFFCWFFQSAAHLFEIPAKLRKFICSLDIQNKIQISFLDILRRLSQFNQRCRHTSVDPQPHRNACEYKNDKSSKKKILRHDLDSCLTASRIGNCNIIGCLLRRFTIGCIPVLCLTDSKQGGSK